ncbi:hypothetical protein IMY05_C4432000400 [Salix suchowensis]|nr:hypothetical protein IMY05_C4432000400 [Salix suchowensis]
MPGDLRQTLEYITLELDARISGDLCNSQPVIQLPESHPSAMIPLAAVLLEYPVAYAPPPESALFTFLGGISLDIYEVILISSSSESRRHTLLKFSCPHGLDEGLSPEVVKERLYNHFKPRLSALLPGLVRLVCLDVFNCMDHFQAGYNTPEDGVLFIEPRRCSCSDEELRTVRTRTSIRHTDSVRSQRNISAISEMQRSSENSSETPYPNRGPSCTITERIPSLNHELRNDTMEDDTLKVTAASVANKVLHRFRCLRGKQAKMNVSDGSVDGGRIGNRRWSFVCCCGSSGSNALFLSSRSFIEDIAVARFSIPVIAIK